MHLAWPSLYVMLDISEWLVRLAMLVYVPQRRSPAAARTWLLLIFLLPWPGVLLYAAIGRIRLPERCANVCFGGRHRNRLFMATGRGLYALYVNTQGAPGG